MTKNSHAQSNNMTKNDPYLNMKLERARELVSTKHYSQAQQEIEEDLEEAPNNPELLTLLADIYNHQDRLTDATLIIDQLLQTGETSYDLFIIKGNVLYQQEHFAEALEYFQLALKKKRTNYLLGRLIQTLLRLNRTAEALYYTQIALEFKPEDPFFLKYLGQIYKKQKEWYRALEIYQKVIELAPRDEFCYKEYLQLKARGWTPQKVEGELKAILKVSDKKDNPYLHALRAQNLKSMGQWEEAIMEYQRAIHLAPGDNFLLKQLGFCYSHLKRFAEAAGTLKIPFIHNPNDIYIRAALISAYKKIKNIEGLIAVLKEALGKHPEAKILYGILRGLYKTT
jgi:tetratricopeptide (TPR) repeat protein